MATSSQQSCSVCIEPYNKSSRKEVSCIECKYTACRSCYETYLLNTVDDAHCMNCRVRWPLSLLYKYFTGTFIRKKWLPYRGQCILDREKSMFPHMMPFIDIEKKYQKVRYDILFYRKKIQFECEFIRPLYPPSVYKSKMEQYNQRLTEALHQKQNEIDPLSCPSLMIQVFNSVRDVYEFPRAQEPNLIPYLREHYRHRFPLQRPLSFDLDQYQHQRRQYWWPCSYEDCKGYVDNKTYQCAVCQNYTCLRCYTSVSPHYKKDHVCDPNDVKSRENIMKNTRQCPKCKTPIHRISGCNQMWCTICFTPFDYKTGKIITHGRIHNPHYFEYLFNPMNPDPNLNQNPNHRIPNERHIDPQERLKRHRFSERMGKIMLTLGFPDIFHWISLPLMIVEQHDICEEYREQIEFYPSFQHSHSFWRLKYLLGYTTEQEWKNFIIQDEQKLNFHRDMVSIIDAWIQQIRQDLDTIKHVGDKFYMWSSPKEKTKIQDISVIQELIQDMRKSEVYQNIRRLVMNIFRCTFLFLRNRMIIRNQYRLKKKPLTFQLASLDVNGTTIEKSTYYINLINLIQSIFQKVQNLKQKDIPLEHWLNMIMEKMEMYAQEYPQFINRYLYALEHSSSSFSSCSKNN